MGLASFSRLQGDAEGLKRAVYNVTGLSAAVALPLYAGMAVVAPQAVQIAFGSRWERSAGLMQVLCIPGMAQAVTSFTHPLVIALGKVRDELRWNLAACGLLVVGFGSSVHFGILGVAWSLAAGTTLLVPARILLMKRWAGTSVRSYCARLLGPGGATGIMIVGVILMVHGLRYHGPVVCLLAGIATGAVCYCASLLLLDRTTVRLLARAMRRLHH